MAKKKGLRASHAPPSHDLRSMSQTKRFSAKLFPSRPGTCASKPKALRIPTTAPAQWPGRCHTDEDVADFVRRIWGPYIDVGLTLRHIEEMDLKLFRAIRNYKAMSNRDWPKDLARLTERGRLADALERVQRDGVEAVTPKELMAVARKLARDISPT
jgi:hypothetical protein